MSIYAEFTAKKQIPLNRYNKPNLHFYCDNCKQAHDTIGPFFWVWLTSLETREDDESIKEHLNIFLEKVNNGSDLDLRNLFPKSKSLEKFKDQLCACARTPLANNIKIISNSKDSKIATSVVNAYTMPNKKSRIHLDSFLQDLKNKNIKISLTNGTNVKGNYKGKIDNFLYIEKNKNPHVLVNVNNIASIYFTLVKF